jgi:hypothetical protein
MAPAASKRRAAASTAVRAVQRQPPAGVEPQAQAQPAQPAQVVVDVEIVPGDGLRRQAGGVAPVGAGQHAHHQRRVLHRAGHRAGHAADVWRLDRHAPVARLEADDAAPGGGQADRAADVGAQVQRAVAGGGSSAGAGAAAAGVGGQIPGVAGEPALAPVEARQARAQHAVVGHRGPGQQHAAGLAQPRGGGRVVGRGHELGRRAAQRHRGAARGDVLLQRQRHAVQRRQRPALPPARLGLACRRARRTGVEGPQRLHQRLQALDAGDHGIDDLAGRQRTCGVGAPERSGRQRVQCAPALVPGPVELPIHQRRFST